MGEGLPSKRILDYANLYDADPIAMRVYSRKHTVSAHRIGSTVKNVLKKSSIPVLTLADECAKIPKRVLILTDGTKNPRLRKISEYCLHPHTDLILRFSTTLQRVMGMGKNTF